MCGLTGLLLARRPRRRPQLDAIGETLSRLLLLSEHRGPYATGVASVSRTGRTRIVKHPQAARYFVHNPDFLDWWDALPLAATCLLGHTRYPTQGSRHVPGNNHPLSGSGVLLTHNGHIANADALFRQFDLPRKAEVDSELLLRLAERHTTPAGIAVPAYLADLQYCRGRIAAVLVATACPTQVLFLKGNQPLYAWRNAQRGLLVYASEEGILQGGVGSEGWEAIDLPPGTASLVDTETLQVTEQWGFAFG